MILKVYPTHRAIREEVQEYLNENVILPKMITIDEFFDRVMVIDNKKLLDSDTRVLMLNEACEFENFKKLGFERDFINFLKNSDFFFKFFEELAGEKVEISEIYESDIYADFVEHLQVLKELSTNYKRVLNEHGFYDKITRDKYQLNENFLSEFNKIEFFLEGYLTKFEFEVIKRVSENLNIEINIFIDKFNSKMATKFSEFGIEVEFGNYYKIDFTNKEIVSQQKIKPMIKPEIKAFSNSLMQVSFVFKKIYDFIEIDGFKPEKIAIILPNESFANTLRIFDTKRNLNFAMGIEFRETLFYKKIEAMLNYLTEKTNENLDRIKNLNIEELTKEIQKIANKKSYDKFLEIVESLKDEERENKIKSAIDSEVYRLHKFDYKLKNYTTKHIFSFFLKRIRELRIDDIGGGKIKVLGVLESRGVEFDGVIIVDFNEGIVPRISQKDIFLNSKIRAKASLPTKRDRENLQKYFYKRLLTNSKKVALSYVSSEEQIPSRFLNELGFHEAKEISDYEYSKILFDKHTNLTHFNKEIVLEIDLKSEPLSSSKLKDFLDCKRKFYYRYIKKLKSHDISIMPKAFEIGVLLHDVFKNTLTPEASYNSKKEMYEAISTELFKRANKNEFLIFEANLWMERLSKFISYEFERLKEVKILEVEKSFGTKENRVIFEEFNLTGRIDRVDLINGEEFIIDYKVKSSEVKVNEDDFQLIFYSIAKDTPNAFFYDVKRARLVRENNLSEKIDILREKLGLLKEKEINFSKCENKSICNFCDYKVMCER